MQHFDGNKDKKLTWLALLFGNDKGLTGGGKTDSTDDGCHRQKGDVSCPAFEFIYMLF
jgi:hypothetical protein